jgi:hypothetical protein
MEVYWDALSWSYEVRGGKPLVISTQTQVADLRYRGYSRLRPVERRRPDTPIYEVESTAQRWLDLEGYYTRFGDVRELIATVDDRYVIMNAGDELALEFAAPPPPADGWRRDFVLVGDGWVKDGDFNTAFSQWLHPLPRHDQAAYGPPTPLADDPVYRRHVEDWRDYHTRYVSPRDGFFRILWPRSDVDDSSNSDNSTNPPPQPSR